MKWLLLDCNFLMHRAYHAMKPSGMSYEGIETGVLFGFLRDVLLLSKQFDTENIAFCFDSADLLRKQVYPRYKDNRSKPKTEEEREAKRVFYDQVKEIRTNILPSLGANVFYEDGFEADDLIASICKVNSVCSMEASRMELVIVSCDEDLYQLLERNIWMWNPMKKLAITKELFSETYGIGVKAWAEVKAIAGCSGDNVKGVVGVGEVTAIKYLRGKLNRTSKAYRGIEEGLSNGLVANNRKLVTLPYKGCPTYHLKASESIFNGEWNTFVKSKGMETLIVNNGFARSRK